MSQGCGVEWGTLNLLAAGAASRYFAVGLVFFFSLPPPSFFLCLIGCFICQVLLPGLAIWVASATPNVSGRWYAQSILQFVMASQELWKGTNLYRMVLELM